MMSAARWVPALFNIFQRKVLLWPELTTGNDGFYFRVGAIKQLSRMPWWHAPRPVWRHLQSKYVIWHLWRSLQHSAIIIVISSITSIIIMLLTDLTGANKHHRDAAAEQICGLWLVESDHLTWILASDWSANRASSDLNSEIGGKMWDKYRLGNEANCDTINIFADFFWILHREVPEAPYKAAKILSPRVTTCNVSYSWSERYTKSCAFKWSPDWPNHWYSWGTENWIANAPVSSIKVYPEQTAQKYPSRIIINEIEMQREYLV